MHEQLFMNNVIINLMYRTYIQKVQNQCTYCWKYITLHYITFFQMWTLLQRL